MARLLIVFCLAFLLIGCSSSYKPNTTDRAAGVGAVVGAGLGAIIGSGVGDPLSGMAIGAVAGGGVGSMIGNQFQVKEEQLAQQSEVITTQEKELSAQKSEIEELRRESQERVKFNSEDIPVRFSEPRNEVVQIQPEQGRLKGSNYAAVSPISPKFENITEPEPKAAYDWKQGTAKVGVAVCKEGDQEYALAKTKTESAEKLYHLRRALRVCPEQAVYHNAIGEIYLELQRIDDARFEFNEALRINPDFAEAKNNLNRISG